MMILKLKWTILLLFSSIILLSQDTLSLKKINATSEKVSIRVGDDYFAKDGWHLEPSKNPDEFKIGSKWNYENLEVSFITDIDSIAFDVNPGNKYDFVIMLNGDTACYIQIITAPNPVLMNWKILASLSLIFITLIILCSQISKPSIIIYLLYFGLLSPFLFWLFTFIGGSIHGNYDHTRNAISELGMVGSAGETFMSISLIIISVFSVAFSIGFYKASNLLNISKKPAVLTFFMPLSLLWASIFPLGNEFHGTIGASPLLLIVGALAAYFLWKNKRGFYKMSCWSLFSGLVMLLIMLRFIKPFGQDYEGLIQRFYYVGWTIWFFTLSLSLTKKMKNTL